MRKYSKFSSVVDFEREKDLDKKIACINLTIKECKAHMLRFFPNVEPNERKVSSGSILRCIECMESMVVLAKNGYVGSANALLRQICEYIGWAKITIDNFDNINVLNELHDSFYDFEAKRANVLSKYLNRIVFCRVSDKSEIESDICRTEINSVFSSYSFLTHATCLAQQCPVQIISFYDNMESFLEEFVIWVMCLVEVIISYSSALGHNIEKKNDYFDVLKFYGTLNCSLEPLQKGRGKLRSMFCDTEELSIYKVICNTRWRVRIIGDGMCL